MALEGSAGVMDLMKPVVQVGKEGKSRNWIEILIDNELELIYGGYGPLFGPPLGSEQSRFVW